MSPFISSGHLLSVLTGIHWHFLFAGLSSLGYMSQKENPRNSKHYSVPQAVCLLYSTLQRLHTFIFYVRPPIFSCTQLEDWKTIYLLHLSGSRSSSLLLTSVLFDLVFFSVPFHGTLSCLTLPCSMLHSSVFLLLLTELQQTLVTQNSPILKKRPDKLIQSKILMTKSDLICYTTKSILILTDENF